MHKRAVIYCRISDDREGRRLGVERQEEDGYELAARYEYDVLEVIVENDISASTNSTKPRPKFERMLKLAEQNAIDAILATSSSRLTRRPMEGERLIQLYDDHGTLIHYKNTNDNDLSTARGRRRARDDAARDAEYAEELSELVARDVVRRAKAGLFHGGSRSFGWTRDHQLDEYEHPILVECAERALAGESLRAICRELTSRAIPRVTWHPPLVLKPWDETVLKQMLVNPRLAGWRTHNGKIVGKAVWPAALPEETWQALRGLLTDPRRDLGSRGRVNLLSGCPLCGECDRPMSVMYSSSRKQGRRRKFVCEHCKLYRDMAPVTAYVEAAVIRLLEDYEEEPASVDPEAAKAVERLRKKIEETKLEFTDDDTVTPQELREMLRHLRGRLTAEEAKLQRARRNLVVEGATGEHAAAAWETHSLDRKQAIIRSLVVIRLHRAKPGRNAFDPDTVEILER